MRYPIMRIKLIRAVNYLRLFRITRAIYDPAVMTLPNDR